MNPLVTTLIVTLIVNSSGVHAASVFGSNTEIADTVEEYPIRRFLPQARAATCLLIMYELGMSVIGGQLFPFSARWIVNNSSAETRAAYQREPVGNKVFYHMVFSFFGFCLVAFARILQIARPEHKLYVSQLEGELIGLSRLRELFIWAVEDRVPARGLSELIGLLQRVGKFESSVELKLALADWLKQSPDQHVGKDLEELLKTRKKHFPSQEPDSSTVWNFMKDIMEAKSTDEFASVRLDYFLLRAMIAKISPNHSLTDGELMKMHAILDGQYRQSTNNVSD